MADSDLIKKVNFHYLDVTIGLRKRKFLKLFILKIFKKEKKPIHELNLIFCSDAYLLKINQEFLHHDELTDIITFDLSSGSHIKGEIYISQARVRINARLYNSLISHELHRVMFHGVLHLCGYKDKSFVDKKQMREKENFYLSRYFKLVSRETRST